MEKKGNRKTEIDIQLSRSYAEALALCLNEKKQEETKRSV
jgi:hypothetical protein